MHATTAIFAICFAATCAHAEDTDAQRTGFAALDSNHNGYISAAEASKRRGLSELLHYFDADLDGRLSLREYERLRNDAAQAVKSWAQAIPAG